MGQLAPSVQQMIAQQPALQAQMAQYAVEAANRRNAQAYQGIDQIGQNILKAMGMYGQMQEKKEARATDEQRYQDELAFRNDEATYKRWERQDAAALAEKNRGEDLAFRDAKFEHEKYVQLEKLVLDGNMSAAQIDSMAKAGKLTDVQVERLIQMLPSDVRKGEAGADAAEAGNEEFKNSEPYRRAMEEFSLQQAEANVASTQAGTAATTGAEGRAASMHPFQQRLAANAANMSDQEFSEWMMSKDFRDQKQQFELDQMDANIQGTHATTDSIQSKRWRDEDMAPLQRMQAQENILGTRSQTTARDMLLIPQMDSLNASTRAAVGSEDRSRAAHPIQLEGMRHDNMQRQEQIRSTRGQEDRTAQLHQGQMELQGINLSSARLALEGSAIKHTFLKEGLEAEHQNLLSRTGLQDAQASVLEAQARIAANPVAASPEKWQKSVQEEITTKEFNLTSRMDSISTMLGNDTLLKEMMRTPEGKDALLSLTIEQSRISAALPKLAQLRITMADGTFTTENDAWSALGTALGTAGGGKLNPKPLAPMITPPPVGGLAKDEATFLEGQNLK